MNIALTSDNVPHGRVLARLGRSSIAGIGVFAIVNIAAGTDVFQNDRAEILWLDALSLRALNLNFEQKRLYEDFAIRRGSWLGCPAHFDLLTVGWYVNQPANGVEPNLKAADDYALISCRDISAGEELTVCYETYSDPRALIWE